MRSLNQRERILFWAVAGLLFALANAVAINLIANNVAHQIAIANGAEPDSPL